MTDTSPYGVTQNADAEATTANAMVGERISPVVANAEVGSAATFSTAPYKPPMTNGRRTARLGRCLGKGDTCSASPIRGTDLCVFHTPKEVSPEPPAAS